MSSLAGMESAARRKARWLQSQPPDTLEKHLTRIKDENPAFGALVAGKLRDRGVSHADHDTKEPVL
jgi:hypothetical protein